MWRLGRVSAKCGNWGHAFYDSSGKPISNGCLVFPDHSFVFLDKDGQCDEKIVKAANGLCVFDKAGKLIMEMGD